MVVHVACPGTGGGRLQRGFEALLAQGTAAVAFKAIPAAIKAEPSRFVAH